MRTIIYPYKLGSRSARALAQSLDAIRVRPVGRYKPRSEDFILNWGASTTPAWDGALNGKTILNKPEAVKRASNKLSTFVALRDGSVPTIPWTTSWDTASDWDTTVVVRHKLTGHSGEGIEIFGGDMALPPAPLYTKYIRPRAEYRVHVFDGKVIDYIKKRRRNDIEQTEEQNMIRSHQNGWVFTRENLRRLERVEELATNAIKALGLDFGAVDIIRDDDNNCMVLEVNTACGLEGTTLQAYINAFKEYATKQ